MMRIRRSPLRVRLVKSWPAGLLPESRYLIMNVRRPRGQEDFNQTDSTSATVGTVGEVCRVRDPQKRPFGLGKSSRA
jgi:hypothetical protein